VELTATMVPKVDFAAVSIIGVELGGTSSWGLVAIDAGTRPPTAYGIPTPVQFTLADSF
jgi:hypothetical protein